ncbi:MAG TPA: DNA repair protein RecO [Candidatus Acidoferrales bacterium]|nr:DNA repair protein RecO [Candidatus Acidoferrales bacterium]
MPLRESEAIVLQSYPLGEADRLVSFLSRTMGRVRGVAAGARRTKSRFGATLERMSHVRIWFFERETRELVRISQCDLIESFVTTFRDYSAGVTLALMAEITEAVLPDREPADPSFRLLLLSAQTIKRRQGTQLALAYFVLWTVRLGGWLGSFERCGRCGSELAAMAYVNPAIPGVVCPNCRAAGMTGLSASAISVGRKMLSGRLDKLNPKEFSDVTLRELTGYLLDLVEHQIERKLKAREMLETA